MVALRVKRPLDPPSYRVATGTLPASAYEDHVAETARANEAARSGEEPEA